jgi:NADH-quinone oxidoreductase subunit L
LPTWIESIRIKLYVLFLNRLYIDEGAQRLEEARLSLLQRLEKHAEERV